MDPPSSFSGSSVKKQQSSPCVMWGHSPSRRRASRGPATLGLNTHDTLHTCERFVSKVKGIEMVYCNKKGKVRSTCKHV